MNGFSFFTVTKFLQTKFQHFYQTVWMQCLRKRDYVTTTTKHTGIVLVSESDDIFMNLALEDWFYENENLENKSILLMWKNKPTVVIGRHQNPYLECNVWKLIYDEINLARRKSGGGAVYHDEGNLNCSFIKHRSLYNRYKNLNLVVRAMQSSWDVDLSINTREDILLDGFYKVSGTASKLGRTNTYHHFTLIFDVNKDNLVEYLNSPMTTTGVSSRATQSLKSQVKNLSESIPGINFRSLVDVIGQEFLKDVESNNDEMQWIQPNDKDFPGLQKIYDEISDWEWTYGRTPKFSLKKHFVKNLEYFIEHSVTILIEIDKGRLANIYIETNFSESFNLIKPIIEHSFIGTRFFHEDLHISLVKVKEDLKPFADKELNSWVIHCLAKTLFIA